MPLESSQCNYSNGAHAASGQIRVEQWTEPMICMEFMHQRAASSLLEMARER